MSTGVDDYSRLLVSGAAGLVGDTSDIDLMKDVLRETPWEAFDFISAAALQFSDLNFVFTGVEQDFDYFERVENNTLVLEVRAVPKSPTLSLLGVGLIGLVLYRLGKPPALSGRTAVVRDPSPPYPDRRPMVAIHPSRPVSPERTRGAVVRDELIPKRGDRDWRSESLGMRGGLAGRRRANKNSDTRDRGQRPLVLGGSRT